MPVASLFSPTVLQFLLISSSPLFFFNILVLDTFFLCGFPTCIHSFFSVFCFFIHICLFFFPQAYFRQGVALQYLGRHADALAAFASGLAQDPKSLQLLVGMVEAAMKSPLRGRCVRWELTVVLHSTTPVFGCYLLHLSPSVSGECPLEVSLKNCRGSD